MICSVVTLLLVQVASTVLAAPHIQGYRDDPFVTNEHSAPCNNGTGAPELYDQRQNGTENYRINVNGVVVLLAPAETILAAANLPNLEAELSTLKPQTVTTNHEQMGSTQSQVSSHAPESVHTSKPTENCEDGKCDPHNMSEKHQRGKLKMVNNLIQLFRSLKDDSVQQF